MMTVTKPLPLLLMPLAYLGEQVVPVGAVKHLSDIYSLFLKKNLKNTVDITINCYGF